MYRDRPRLLYWFLTSLVVCAGLALARDTIPILPTANNKFTSDLGWAIGCSFLASAFISVGRTLRDSKGIKPQILVFLGEVITGAGAGIAIPLGINSFVKPLDLGGIISISMFCGAFGFKSFEITARLIAKLKGVKLEFKDVDEDEDAEDPEEEVQ